MEINRIFYYERHLKEVLDTLPSAKRKLAKQALQAFNNSLKAYGISSDLYSQIQEGYKVQEGALEKACERHREMAKKGLELYKQALAR